MTFEVGACWPKREPRYVIEDKDVRKGFAELSEFIARHIELALGARNVALVNILEQIQESADSAEKMILTQVSCEH